MNLSIEQQRDVYDRMCREFFAGYPEGVSAQDGKIDGVLPYRRYTLLGSDPAAQVVYFHGGGFVVGGLDSHDDVCAEFCARTGYVVLSVDYRLAPEHAYPANFEDALTGYRFAAETSGLPLILAGDSAGGNLAAAVCHRVRGEDRQPVGQLLIYPGLGGDDTTGSYVEHADAPLLSAKDISFYTLVRTGGKEPVAGDAAYAPLWDDDFVGLPPTVVFSAGCDPLCDDGEVYCKAINAAGGTAHWYFEEGLPHGYLRARHTVARARESFSRMVAALENMVPGD